jgi:hypothetical protein
VEIVFVAGRYRTAYAALHNLGGNINRELAGLTEEDISVAGIFEYTQQLGRGYNTTVSWIWRQTALVAQAQDDNWLDEGSLELVPYRPEPHIWIVLRVQFLEAKVNRDRWAEERELAMTELDFTRSTFEHKQQYWISRVFGAATAGAAAHAHSMAAIYDGMAQQVMHKINSIV